LHRSRLSLITIMRGHRRWKVCFRRESRHILIEGRSQKTTYPFS
jgi:hypothetical protein